MKLLSLHRTIALTALVLTLPLVACGKKEQGPPPPAEVGYVVVRTERVPLTTELAGRTAAFETAEVRPQVGGIVQKRLFTEGTLVRAGQPLYQIDPSLFRAAAAQAEANLQSAEAARTSAQALAGRYKPLAAVEAISKQDYTNALASAQQASASVAQQSAALRTARINLGYSRITAPISGRIGRSSVTAGALVTTGQADPLATIQRLDPIYVDIQQSAAELVALRQAVSKGGLLRASADVTLRLDNGSRYPLPGRLQFAETAVDEATGSVTLRARFPNPDNLLLPGMYVRATIGEGERPSAILAPQQGVSRDPKGGATARVVGADSKVALRNLTVDRAIGDKWLVLDGLKPGDRLIVEGTSKAKPGDLVRPVPAGSPRAAPPQGGSGGGQAKAG